MGKNTGLEYIHRDTVIHSLTGATKLLMTVITSVAVMITFDTRFLIGVILATIAMFCMSRIRFSEIRFILTFVAVILLMNCVIIYLFSPEEGVLKYGTRNELAHIAGGYYITSEQLFYMLNIVLKYFSILPLSLIFITTTNPSEFASSLNKIGVSYKIAYSVALTLRYIPDVRREFSEISQAQQARGIDMSRSVSLPRRVKNASAVLLPLMFSSLSRIDTISNAMELRGFGKHEKRTWYQERGFRKRDFAVIVVCVLLLITSVTLNYVNGGRFFNPFV